MANDALNLGTATVSVRVDTTEVKPALEATKQEVSEATSTMGTDAEKNVGGGFQAAGEKIKETTKGVRTLASSLTATVGILTGILGSITAVYGVIKLIGAAVANIAQQGARIGGLLPEVQSRLEANAAALEKGRVISDAEVALQAKLVKLAEAKEETERVGWVLSSNKSKELAFQAGLDLSGYTIKSQQLKLIEQEREQTTATLRALRERLRLEHETKAVLIEQAEAIKAQEKAYFDLAQRVAEFRAERAKDREDDEQAEAERRRRIRESIREETLERIKSTRERHAEELRLEKSKTDAIAKAIENVNDRITGLNDSTSNTLEALLRRVEVFVDNQGYGR